MSDNQVKCPKCGATDISQHGGMLVCNFCRHEFKPEATNAAAGDEIFEMEGDIITSRTEDINKDAEDMVTLKCQSCGAEVVIDTNESTQARCHWCRNTLSINDKMENGAVPDMILPFGVQKQEAQSIMDLYVQKHKFFAPKPFLNEFDTNNIMGVYFPYLDVDANTHASFEGTGEKLVRRYKVKVGDGEETRYDADLYGLRREFDCGVDDLIVESSLKRMDGSKSETNNIINAILPFDTENCVAYDSNYLRGYTSERRDVNVSDMDKVVNDQIKDIVRYQAKETAKEYDRGVCWEKENVDVKGRLFKSAYLPVWLYSYFEEKTQMLHYVAVNARTKETLGSIPINKGKLLGVTFAIEAVMIIIAILAVANRKRCYCIPSSYSRIDILSRSGKTLQTG